MKSTHSFTQKVYEIASKIPLGKVATYGQIARLSGSPKAARAVGMAMRTNTDTKRVPCHRVVASNGALTGYAFGNGIPQKEKMLRAEGVAFKVDLAISGWKK
jgi:methylated-DNA-protein-cysteine methyltransferase-like protein